VPDSPTPPRAVFLSYASQDTKAARRICESLRAAGLEVWFDQNELVGGDAWDQKIRGQIKACALFVPLISAESQARREGYFRLEWKLAAQRTHTIADGTPFLLPVVIDATRDAEALAPEEFRTVQWTRLPAGETSAAFVARVKQLLGPADPVVGARLVRAQEDGRGQATPLPPKRSTFPWTIAALAVVVLGLVAFIALRPAAKETPATPAKSVAETKVAASSTSVAPQVDAKSIAVLPFVNRSAEKADEFFTDGIHEDILTNLAHIRELHVVSRTSVMDYRGTAKKIPQIARELNVAFILEGSVQRAGNKVRVTGQLIRAANDEHVWAESYDRDLSDVFAIQSELAQKIAGALQATLSPAEQKLIAKRPTENSAAYDAFLKGRGVRAGMVIGPALQEQEAAFQRAVDLDSKFSLAWGELAVVHALFASTGLDQTPARVAKADAAMAKALALEPESPEVLRLLGRYADAAHNDFPRAIAALEKLTRLQPNDGLSWAELAGVERDRYDWSPALVHARKATQLEPASVGFANQLVSFYIATRHGDEALAEQRRVLALRPGDIEQARKLAVLVFQATGDPKPAEAFFTALTPAQANTPDMIFARKGWDFLLGDLQHYLQLDRVFPYHPDLLTLESNPYLQPYAELSAIAFLGVGDMAGARARLGEFADRVRADVANHPAVANFWSGLAVSEAILGHREEALKAARQSVELSKAQRGIGQANSVWRFNAIVAQAWVGEKDLAFAELEQLLRLPMASNIFTQGPLTVYGLRTSPILQPLKNDPRWEALLSDPKNNAPLF
jgi:TolB-like protein/Flp pilus assembly protein TadD